jgi:DNA primase
MTFDILQFYQDHKVHYDLDGKNVMDGYVNTNCPFCDDHSNHLGVNIKKPRKVRCWRCGEHLLPDLLIEFSDKSMKALYQKYDSNNEDIEITAPEIKKVSKSLSEIQKEFLENSTELDGIYKQYLKKRNFNIDKIQKWGICAGIESGDYKYRLMIPVFYECQLVSFQGRDVTNKQKSKYKSCSNVNIKNYLYGLDHVMGDKVIIVEGVTDVWRLSAGNAVATFGIEFTLKQIKLLIEKGIKHVITFFDNEPQAQEAALKLRDTLFMFDINCINFTLKERDPANLTEKEVDILLNQLSKLEKVN